MDCIVWANFEFQNVKNENFLGVETSKVGKCMWHQSCKTKFDDAFSKNELKNEKLSSQGDK